MLKTIKSTKSVVSEAYRTLRTNIDFSNFEGNLQILSIVSAIPAEGKSTIAANLSVSMALNGKKVLIIDGDMRKPTIHKKFMVSRFNGLTKYLLGQKPIDECIVEVENITNLYVMPCDAIPPNPSELLSSKKFSDLLDLLRKKFDMIIIDTPPILAVTDATVISTKVDGVVVVACYGVLKKDQLISATDQIKQVNGRIIGIVENKIPVESEDYYYYYYYAKDKHNHNSGYHRKKRKQG